MANRYMFNVVSIDRMVSKIFGKASITAVTGVISAFSGKGITSVARTGAGEYTIVLDDKFNSIVDLNFSLVGATAEDLHPQAVSYDVATKTIVVNTLTAAVPTDATNAFELVFSVSATNSNAN